MNKKITLLVIPALLPLVILLAGIIVQNRVFAGCNAGDYCLGTTRLDLQSDCVVSADGKYCEQRWNQYNFTCNGNCSYTFNNRWTCDADAAPSNGCKKTQSSHIGSCCVSTGGGPAPTAPPGSTPGPPPGGGGAGCDAACGTDTDCTNGMSCKPNGHSGCWGNACEPPAPPPSYCPSSPDNPRPANSCGCNCSWSVCDQAARDAMYGPQPGYCIGLCGANVCTSYYWSACGYTTIYGACSTSVCNVTGTQTNQCGGTRPCCSACGTPDIPTLVQPTDNTTIKQPIILTWNPISNWGSACAASNNVYISYLDTVTPARINGTTQVCRTSSGVTACQIPSARLVANTRYYWTVRAFNGTRASQSLTRTFVYDPNVIPTPTFTPAPTATNTPTPTRTPTPTPTCAPTAPTAVNLISPVGGANTNTTVVLDWSDTTGWGFSCTPNNRYKVYVSTTNPPPQVTTSCDVSSATSTCTVSGLPEGQPMYWTVVTHNGSVGTPSTTTATFTPYINDNWYQISGGDIHTNDLTLGISPAIRSIIPNGAPNMNLIKDLTSFPGILTTASGAVDLGTNGGVVSSRLWMAGSRFAGRSYDYSSVQPLAANMTSIPTTLNASQLANLATGNYQAAGNLTINGVQSINGKKLVVLIPGDLTLGSTARINLANSNGSEFLAFIVGGNINIDPNIPGTEAAPALEGIYVSSGVLRTGTKGVDQDAQLVIRGSVVAHGGIQLQRDLPQAIEKTQAGELFIFRPDLLISLPTQWGRKITRWTEAAP